MNKKMLIVLICLSILMVASGMSGLSSASAAPGGKANPQTSQKSGLVQYELTIGRPPLAGALVSGLTTWPWLSTPSGAMVTSGKGVIKTWLPKGVIVVTAQVGCSIYAGITSGRAPYTCMLIKVGARHDFSGPWKTDGNQHWKVCRNAGCGAEMYRGAHIGGKATCTKQAVCSVCGASYGAPLGHDFEDGFTVDLAPTCTVVGNKSRHCSRCGEVTDVTPIPATGHSFSGEWTSDADGHWHAATCGHDEIDGYAAHMLKPDDGDCTTPVVCSVCGYTVIPAATHIWGAWQTSATEHWHICANDGCTQVSAHEAHTGGTATCTEAAVCSVCGASYGAPLGHDFEDGFTVDLAPTCTVDGSQSRHCSRCGEVTDVTPIPATGHSFSEEWTSDADGHWHAATCGHDEISGYAAHSGGMATCTQAAVCSVCGASYGAPLGHSFEDGFTVDLAPTCTVDGSKSRHCSRCGEVTDVTPIPATGHSFSEEWTSDADGHWHAATCGHDEIDGYAAHSGGTATCTQAAVCSVCGASYGAPLGHDFEDGFTVDLAPTCTVAGSKSRHCSRCGEVTDVTPIPATGHAWGEWTVLVAATCDSTGTEERICANDPLHSETRAVPVDPNAHNWGGWTTVTPATATEPGLEKRVCLTNPEHFETREIPIDPDALDWGAWTPVTPATCTAAGLERRVCLTDPERIETREISIDPDAHAWDAGAVTTRATCTAEGVRTFTCLNDPAHTRTQVIPISEHTHTVTIINPPGATLDVSAYDASSGIVTPIESGAEVACGTQIFIEGRLESAYDWADSGVYVNGSPYEEGLYPVSGDMAITGRTELRTFTVTITAGAGGTCTPGGEVTVVYDGELTVSLTPDLGYRVKRVFADEADYGPISSYTFYCVQSNTRALSAEFVRVYDITASAGEHGSISPAGTTTVDAGSSMTYAITPDSGCKVKDVLVDGESVGAITSYTFTDAAEAHTIHAVFEEQMHTITASAGEHGSISPAGATTVRAGTDLTYSITPDAGYRIKDVKVDGVSEGIRVSYTFTNIQQPHAISAEFEIIPYAIAASAGANGAISPPGTTEMAPGSNILYAIAPNWGYKVADVKVDGVSVGQVTLYAFTDVRASHTIAAEFEPIYHTISAPAGSGGSVTPAGATSVRMGTNITYTVAPDPGMMILSVKVDGAQVAGPSFTPITYTFSNVTGAHLIEATYAQKFDVTTTAETGGRISPSGTVSCQAGKDLTFTIAADAGYKISYVLVDGVSVGEATSCTFSHIDRNHTIFASFDKLYDIVASAGEHGTISPPGVTTLIRWSSAIFRIAPDEGYKIKDVLVDGVSVGAVPSVTFERLDRPHTIYATFWAAYNITASAGANGTISPAGVTTVEAGNSVAYTITPAAGYKVRDVLVDGASVGPVASYTIKGDFKDHTISATFLKGYYITSSASQLGQISPLGTTAVEVGGSLKYTFAPDANCRVKDVLVDGVSVGKAASYTFANVQAAHTIEAKFELDLYVIKASAGPYGTISPPGETTVYGGASQTYIITPDAGYNIKDVKMDGVSVGKYASYAFTDIRADHTITAEFWVAYNITASAGAGGTISPSGVTTVQPGASITYTITPDWGMQIGFLVVDGTPISTEAYEPITYAFNNVTSNHTIQAVYFSISKVTASAGSHGQIFPSGEKTYASGSNPAYTITPDAGYRIKDVLVDGQSAGPVSSYIFHSIAGNRTIAATFEEDVYTITASAGAGGAISPSGSVQVPRGLSKAFTITPSTGYKVESVMVDGVNMGGVTTYTFPGITAHHTISATFARLTYQITATAGPGGTITPSGITTVDWGASQQYTITPNAGYRVKDVKMDNASVGAVSSYTFSDVTASRTIQATFEQITYTITASAGAGGSIAPSGVTTLVWGAGQQYTLTPAAGYVIRDVLVDGASVGRVASYTFANVTAAHTIAASFAPTYRIEALPSTGGGAITPAGVTNVPQGDDQTYTITPDVGYHITRVQVDGLPAAPGPSYTFINVTGPHIISANFEKTNYTITVPGIVGGKINVPPTAQYGDSVKLGIQITDLDYQLKEGSIKVNGVAITGNVFSMPAENVTITAELEKIAFQVTVVKPANGIVLAPPKSVRAGAPVTLDVRPDAGYRLKAGSLKVNGAAISGTTFIMPAQDVTVTAEFEQYLFQITVVKSDHGKAISSLPNAEAVTLVTLTVTPDTGYRLVPGSLKLNGVTIDGGLIFAMPAQDVTITAEFEWCVFTISVTPAAHGTITAPSPQAEAGTAVYLNVSPDKGYRLVAGSLKMNGVALFDRSFVMPMQDVTITAAFELAGGAMASGMQSFGAPAGGALGGTEGSEAPAEEAPDGGTEGLEAPAGEAPSGGTGGMEAPAGEAPDGGTEGLEAPAEKAPSVGTEGLEAPAEEAPDGGTGGMEAPAEEAPGGGTEGLEAPNEGA